MDKYKNIINLPHKQSTKRPHISLLDRAAQFAPFAALTGYDDAVNETARLTEQVVFYCRSIIVIHSLESVVNNR